MSTTPLTVPATRPKGRPDGFQRWRSLLFLHWRVAPQVIQALLPAGLEVDVFEGAAYVGVVPFTMRDVSPWWAPSVPGISNFHELNVRTYVRHKGVPGVWFFSLDAASSVAVLVARAFWHLPYHRASMALTFEHGEVRYSSRRRWPKPLPGALEASYRIGVARGTATPGSVEHFLLERYVLFAQRTNGSIALGRVHHEPYPFYDVEQLSIEQTMTDVNGLGPCGDAPAFAHFSPGVDVDIYGLE